MQAEYKHDLPIMCSFNVQRTCRSQYWSRHINDMEETVTQRCLLVWGSCRHTQGERQWTDRSRQSLALPLAQGESISIETAHMCTKLRVNGLGNDTPLSSFLEENEVYSIISFPSAPPNNLQLFRKIKPFSTTDLSRSSCQHSVFAGGRSQVLLSVQRLLSWLQRNCGFLSFYSKCCYSALAQTIGSSFQINYSQSAGHSEAAREQTDRNIGRYTDR
jgi:hypothetical protein